mgnify:CR=1 FL=1
MNKAFTTAILLSAALLWGVCVSAQDPWLEENDGIGQYDYIEKESTTYVHYGTYFYEYNYSEVWVDVHSGVPPGVGHNYQGTWQSGNPPEPLNLSTGNLNTINHSTQWVAGASIDLYLKVWDYFDVVHQTIYNDEMMILDVEVEAINGSLEGTSQQLVLQFSVDAGTNVGRELFGLWVRNLGTLEEGHGNGDINYDKLRLYFETGTAFSFDGTEDYATLWGDWGGDPTNNERWGNESLYGNSGYLFIPSDGVNKLLCYVVIEEFNSTAQMGRTAQFEIELDGMSLDGFGMQKHNKVRMDAQTQPTALCLGPTPSFTESPVGPTCQNTAVTYTTQEGMSDYTWTLSGTENTDYTVTAGSLGGHTLTVVWLTSGEKTVTVNYSENGCPGEVPASVTHTVLAAPSTSEIYHD